MMARKLFFGSSQRFIVHCGKDLSLCNLSMSLRHYGKKEYNFDLDSLIEWNKDTSLAFGNPAKLTKTGKIRKSRKNSDEKLRHNLEQSHAVSVSAQVTSSMDYENETNIKSKTRQKHKNNDSEVAYSPYVPEYFFEDEIPDFSNRKEIKKSSSLSETSKSAKGSADREMTDDGIYIPKIKPIPQHNSAIKINQHDDYKITHQPGLQNMSLAAEGSPQRLHSPPNQPENKTPPHLINSTKARKTEKISKSKFQSTDRPPQVDLPAEAPESFSIITECPLTFNENGQQLLSSKLERYKHDVEKLALRTPPSVKTILSRTMPDLNRFFLNRWREGMIKELGEEGFKIHQDATIKRGINFHANIMELMSGRPVSEIQIMPDNEGHWASLQSAVSLVTDVQALEEDVKHPFLSYRGVFDCIARYKDLLCVVDWKTSKKPRPLLKNTYDDPLQIAAYVGAFNASNMNASQDKKINHGVIVVVYPDGSPAHVHMMNQTQCEHYWREWTDRLYNYYQLIYTSKFG